MNRKFAALLALLCIVWPSAQAEDSADAVNTQTPEPEVTAAPETTPVPEMTAAPGPTLTPEPTLPLTREYRWFVNEHKNVRGRTVTYYDNVYAVNHKRWGLTPFADVVPAKFFVEDEMGMYAVAPIVMDIVDAMRVRLYGADIGELGLLYGQYCDRITGMGGRVGFSGIHEGIDFISAPGTPLHAILGGEVTRAGDSNGTVGIYTPELDITLLYLHCEEIEVRRGDVIDAGATIAVEGSKKSGSPYAHVEFRYGHHTSSSPYRDTALTSDCPYDVMQQALGVVDSGRAPITYAATQRTQQGQTSSTASPAATPQSAALPGTLPGYGFGAQPTPTPQVTSAPQGTLPPSST